VTSEDRQAQIDRRFDETFAVFDERMRKEQEAVSQERASRGPGSGTGGSGEVADTGEESGASGNGGGTGSGQEPGNGDGSDGRGSDSGGRGQDAGSGSSAQGGGGYGGGAKGGGGPNTVPSDIPDGSDDDIVARQLREAAMKETDPELRERLWDEYRKYKQSTR
jgi:hypothetical protein